MLERIGRDEGADEVIQSAPDRFMDDRAVAAIITPESAPPSPAVITLSSINGANGFYLPGLIAYDYAGRSVAIAGDVNGDGIDDFIIGAEGANRSGPNSSGESYVVFGRTSGFPATFDLTTLDGTNGFRIRGVHYGDDSGEFVASAGDINGDGIGDLVVLSSGYGTIANGAAAIIFGRAHGFEATLDPSTLDGHNGFVVTATQKSSWVQATAASADVNHDGFDDLIIGARYDLFSTSPNTISGAAYIIFGHAGGFDSSISVTSLTGSNGFQVGSIGYSDHLGTSVSSAGDINDDGIEDMMLLSDQARTAYVIFGTTSPFSATFDLKTLNGSNGLRITGSHGCETISLIGDINGDGHADLLLGAPGVDGGATSSGVSYVVFGRQGGYAADIVLDNLDGTNGFRINGVGAYDTFGSAISSAGDFNGDGFADFIISAPLGDASGPQNAGSSYVVFGRAGGYLPVLDLTTLDGTSGFRIDGVSAQDLSGYSVAGGGDINGDGYDDIIVSASEQTVGGRARAGGAYVIYGHATPANTTVIGTPNADVLVGHDGNDKIDGQAGADRMYGGLGDDQYRVDSAGDLVFENAGEGNDTVIASIGHYLFANVENLTLAAGAGDVFGVGNELANIVTGNEGSNLLIAGAGDDVVHGGAGVDSLFGQDGNDHLFGDAGIDYLVGGNGDDVIDGGTSADALYGEDGNDTLSGGTDFQTDILVGGNGNDVLHGDSGLGDYDLMDGGAGDDAYYVDTPADLTFEAVGGGTDTVYASISGAGYYLYANVENLVLQGNTPYGVGNELDNHLTGNASANYLLGGAGNDMLNGKGGNDVLFGESGADTFVFEHGTGGDVIGDFLSGTDKIDLSAFGFANFQALVNAMHEVNGTTAIDLGGGDFIVINGVAEASLHAGDFILGGGTASLVVAALAIDTHSQGTLPSDNERSNHFAAMPATTHAADWLA